VGRNPRLLWPRRKEGIAKGKRRMIPREDDSRKKIYTVHALQRKTLSCGRVCLTSQKREVTALSSGVAEKENTRQGLPKWHSKEDSSSDSNGKRLSGAPSGLPAQY